MGLFDVLGKIVAPVAKVAGTVAGFIPGVPSGVTDALKGIGEKVGGEMQNVSNAAKAEELQNQAYSFQREMNEAQQIFNREEAQKARDFNAEQAQITRDFNSAEAEKQRAFTQQMYEQQRDDNQAWNDIGAQMERAAKAGVNPLAMNGDTMSLANPSSGAMAQGGASASSPMASFHPNGALSLANPTLDPLVSSQIDLLQSQKEKADSDADLSKEQAEDYRLFRQGKLRIQDMDWLIKTSDYNKSYQEFLNLQTEADILAANASKLSEEIIRMRIENEKLPEYLDAQTEKMLAEAGFSKQEANYMYQQYQNAITTGKAMQLDFEIKEAGHQNRVSIEVNETGRARIWSERDLEYEMELYMAQKLGKGLNALTNLFSNLPKGGGVKTIK